MEALSRGSLTLLSSYKKNKHHSPATPGGPITGITLTVTQLAKMAVPLVSLAFSLALFKLILHSSSPLSLS